MSSKTYDKVTASPTKDFFVSMLTRDISLPDAILDLVDNSLDGKLRNYGDPDDYEGYWAKIEFDADRFEITDNCGGLERKIAAEYAFKFGRESRDSRDSEIETIGMYGIGMKRSMFKMGLDCNVLTYAQGNDHYQVTMDRPWLQSRSWGKIPISKVPRAERLAERGTRIRVRDLRPGVKATFQEAAFLKDLTDGLSQHFSRFVQRGFEILVNKTPIEPVRVEILYEPGGQGLKPYYFTCPVGKTTIHIAMGLNPRTLSPESDPDPDHSLAVPGWSVYCNDRAVLVGDTSKLTGWADPPVPRYHDQYDILTGIVEFRASDARDLPVTTTKRNLDASSEAWLTARSYMRRAARKMISHTNDWKNHRSEHKQLFKNATAINMQALTSKFSEGGEAAFALKKRQGTDVELEYNPEKDLPKRKKGKASDSTRIAYSRPKRRVQQLADSLLGDAQAKPAAVGEASFEFAFRELVGTKR